MQHHTIAEQLYVKAFNEMGLQGPFKFKWFKDPVKMFKAIKKRKTALGFSRTERYRPEMEWLVTQQDQEFCASIIKNIMLEEIKNICSQNPCLEDTPCSMERAYYKREIYYSENIVDIKAPEAIQSKMHNDVYSFNNKTFLEASTHSYWGSFKDNEILLCEKPKRLVIQDGMVHYDHGKAIEFPSGWGGYVLQNVIFDKRTYNKIINRKITFSDLTDIHMTAEKRAVAVSMMDPDIMLKGIGAIEISTGTKYKTLRAKYGDEYCQKNMPYAFNQETVLYEVRKFHQAVTGLQPPTLDTTQYCMKMKHPSQSDYYIEWVDPQIGEQKDADLAQATAFGWTKEQYLTSIEG